MFLLLPVLQIKLEPKFIQRRPLSCVYINNRTKRLQFSSMRLISRWLLLLLCRPSCFLCVKRKLGLLLVNVTEGPNKKSKTN